MTEHAKREFGAHTQRFSTGAEIVRASGGRGGVWVTELWDGIVGLTFVNEPSRGPTTNGQIFLSREAAECLLVQLGDFFTHVPRPEPRPAPTPSGGEPIS
jgi:hypothetical protein